MRVKDLYKLSTRMFKARTSRTLLTILGMGVGISAILFLVSLGYGIQRALLETITTTDSLLALDVYPGKESLGMIKNEELENIKNISGVAEVSPVFQSKSQIKFENIFSEANAFVVDYNFMKLKGNKFLGGSDISDKNVSSVVITPTLAKIFQKNPEEMIGEKINLSLAIPENNDDKKKTKNFPVEKDFEIVGYIDSKDNAIFINQKGVEGSIDLPGYTQIKIKCEKNEIMNSVREKLISEGFIVSSLTDIIDQVNEIFKIVRIILTLFGVIALIVSAIGMFNTMTVTLLERTEEIGIMKSIGAYNKDISSMFIFESMVMGFLGGVFGIILGLFEGVIFNFGVNLIASYFGGQQADIFYTPFWLILFILFSGIAVGFLTGIVPARRARAIDPLDALRYK